MKDKFSETSYVLPENVHGKELVLLKDEAHHLSRVLRQRRGDLFVATDGLGLTFECKIVTVEKDRIIASIHGQFSGRGELKLKLTLALGLIRRDKFEWAVEKCTELGVTRFLPVITDKTVVHTNTFRLERCKRISISAIKQCCRSKLPTIAPPLSFDDMLASFRDVRVRLIAHESLGEEMRLPTAMAGFADCDSVVICIGPEGGFTESEVARSIEHGFMPVSLGARRLRSETAAVAAVSVILGACSEI